MQRRDFLQAAAILPTVAFLPKAPVPPNKSSRAKHELQWGHARLHIEGIGWLPHDLGWRYRRANGGLFLKLFKPTFTPPSDSWHEANGKLCNWTANSPPLPEKRIVTLWDFIDDKTDLLFNGIPGRIHALVASGHLKIDCLEDVSPLFIQSGPDHCTFVFTHGPIIDNYSGNDIFTYVCLGKNPNFREGVKCGHAENS
jgi:hypothetical protein